MTKPKGSKSSKTKTTNKVPVAPDVVARSPLLLPPVLPALSLPSSPAHSPGKRLKMGSSWPDEDVAFARRERAAGKSFQWIGEHTIIPRTCEVRVWRGRGRGEELWRGVKAARAEWV